MRILIANWKMYLSVAESIALAKKIWAMRYDSAKTRLVVCPNHVALAAVSAQIKKPTLLGSQDVFWETEGAFTGEVGPAHLKEVGCSHVIIGHSERRINLHESDEMVNRKLKAALAAGLTPVFAVGETLKERRAGYAKKRVAEELKNDLKGLTAKDTKKIIFAYEPIWAIGTGVPIHPKAAKAMHDFIREQVARIVGDASAVRKLKIIYGGSVNPENVREFLNAAGVDGCLVGKSSTSAALLKALLQQYGL